MRRGKMQGTIANRGWSRKMADLGLKYGIDYLVSHREVLDKKLMRLWP